MSACELWWSDPLNRPSRAVPVDPSRELWAMLSSEKLTCLRHDHLSDLQRAGYRPVDSLLYQSLVRVPS
jgi:hypothetical protein